MVEITKAQFKGLQLQACSDGPAGKIVFGERQTIELADLD
jgi:hypothetical protein